MQKRLIKTSILAVAFWGGTVTAGFAGPVTLTDGNSTAFFDSYVHPRNSAVTINGYWRDWTVDGTDNLFQSRIGVRGLGPLVTMNVDSSGVADTNSDGNDDTFSIQRSKDGLQIDTSFSLLGGIDGSGRSTMNWTTDFINTSGEDMTLTLFQMVDFDLGAAHDDEYGQMVNNNNAKQWDDQTMVSMAMAQGVDHYYCGTPMWAGRYFRQFGGTDLGDGASFFGPDDVGWIFQWDLSLAANGGSFQIDRSYDVAPVPEPATMLLFGTGIVGLMLTGTYRTRRKK